MGSATLEPSGPVEAGSLQALTLVYRAGAYGIDDTGSIKIGFRFATDLGPLQFDDPQGQGYTTAEASNGALLELKWEFKRNIRPWSRSLYVGVMRHFLRPDDTITIRFGDTRFGSPGVRMQTYCESRFEFRVFVDAMATYDYVPLPESPHLAITAGAPLRWQAILPTLVRAGERFLFALKIDDKWGNPTDRCECEVHLRPEHPIDGLPERLVLTPGHYGAVVDGLTATKTTSVDVLDGHGKLLCKSNVMVVAEPSSVHRHYWGDTHGQSDETLGTNSAREYFQFGRDRAHLDVMGHQGNDFQISSAFWRQLNELSRELDEPGRFVCIPGYEWSANTAVGGDRNVHYRHEGETIHRSSHAQIYEGHDRDDRTAALTATELFERLAGKDCVVMAHVGGRYADIVQAHDGRLETAVEVHSAWGTFEWLLWDAFESNYRVGIVANSDGHKGRPGACYPGASFFGSYGGLTCFLAERLDRDAIFECMRRRRHYATTGNRLYMSVAATTATDAEVFIRDPAHFEAPATERSRRLLMGDIARVAADSIDLHIEVIGTAPIERLDILDGNEVLETVRPYTTRDLGARVRLVYEGAEYRGRARTTTWDGGLAVEGNKIVRASVFNNWNLDRGIQRQNAGGLAWKAVTTGNFGGIDIWLGRGIEGKLNFETRLVRGGRSIASLGLERHVFSAGGLERAIHLYRLPELMTETRVAIKRPVRLRPRGDTRLFIRVTQEDGHRAWSSPIYLFR